MLLLIVLGCAADRVLIELPVVALGAPALATPALASPAAGVELSFTEATLTLADLRFEAPATAARAPALLRGPALLPLAHAHPGHDFDGAVQGELVGEWTVDLLGEDLELGLAALYEGDFATARLTLPAGGAARFEGSALVDGVARPFRFELTPDQDVTGLPFVFTLDPEAPPGGISLAVDLAHALSFVDWRSEDDGDGLLTLDDGALANTVAFGVVSTPTYTLDAWSAP